MDQPDLVGILKRCLARGTESDWEHFIRRAQQTMAIGVLRALGTDRFDRNLVDDLVQQTFLRLCDSNFRILRAFRGESENALHVYLRTVAASTAIDHLRAGSSE